MALARKFTDQLQMFCEQADQLATQHSANSLLFLMERPVDWERLRSAVGKHSVLLAGNFNHDWEVGPMCHAIHALRLYDERVFQPYDGLDDNIVKKPAARKTAKRPSSSRTSTKPR